MAMWPLRHAALADNYRLITELSRKRSIIAGEMYLTICVEYAADHFGFGLT